MEIKDWKRSFNHKSFLKRHTIIESLDKLQDYFPELINEFKGLSELTSIFKNEITK